MIRKLVFAAAATLLLAAPASAIPLTADDVGESGTTTILGISESYHGSNPVPGLQGTLFLKLTDYQYVAAANQTVLDFNYKVTNTTTSNLTSHIGSWGLMVNPDVSDVNIIDGYFNSVKVDPNGSFSHLGKVDFCFFVGNGGCNGGEGESIGNNESGSGNFELVFAGNVTTVNLQQAFFRFQGITGTTTDGFTFKSTGDSGAGFNNDVNINPTVIEGVPETSTWLMMIAGFLGVGGIAYRKRRNERLVRLA